MYWFSREYNILSSSIFQNWSLGRYLIMSLIKLKNTSNQFELRSSDFCLTRPHWLTYSTTWLPLIWYHYLFIYFSSLKVEVFYTMINFFPFLFSFRVSFVSTLEVFPNVASKQFTFKSMNLGKSMRVMLNQWFKNYIMTHFGKQL